MNLYKSRILIRHPCMQLEPTLYLLFWQPEVCLAVTGSDRVWPITYCSSINNNIIIYTPTFQKTSQQAFTVNASNIDKYNFIDWYRKTLQYMPKCWVFLLQWKCIQQQIKRKNVGQATHKKCWTPVLSNYMMCACKKS